LSRVFSGRGNVTGPALISDQLVGKELELRQVAPKATRVAVLWNPTNPGNTHQLREAEAAASALGVRLLPVGGGEIDRAFVAIARERVGALLMLMDAMFMDRRGRIAELAAKSRLPAAYGYSVFPEASPSTSIKSSRVLNPPICPSRNRRNSSWSSISRPPKRSA